MAIVPKESILDCNKSKLKPNSYLIWTLLCEVQDKRQDDVFLDLGTAKKAGVGKSSYYDAFEQLEEKGWIQYSRKLAGKKRWKLIKGFSVIAENDDKVNDFLTKYGFNPIAIYREFYPKIQPDNFQKEAILEAVANEFIWREALQFWRQNSYIGKNIGNILKKYGELLIADSSPKSSQNGRSVFAHEESFKFSEESESDVSIFSEEIIFQHFANVSEVLQDVANKTQNGFRSILISSIEKIEILKESKDLSDVDGLDRSLCQIQTEIESCLQKNCDEKILEKIRLGVIKELSVYRDRMSDEVYERSYQQMLSKELRKNIGIPHLGLYSL